MRTTLNGRPTIRRAKNKGWTPIRWNGPHQIRHGWIYKETPKSFHVQLIGDERGRVLNKFHEGRYITEL